VIHLKWTITQLQKYRDKGLVLDEQVDVSTVMDIDKQIRAVSPIHVTGRVDIGTNEITFHIHIEGELTLPCSRTLVDVLFPVDVKTTETFLLRTDYDPEQEHVTVVKGDVIDLYPIIQENVLLEVPMQVFCDDANPEGATPQSGNDWSVISEEEQEKKVDPRLAGLAKFFDNDKQ
jgi:uncharacterized protein